MRRIATALSGLGLSLMLGMAAQAAEFRPFVTADFEAARAEGRPVIVDIAADWCPTCKAQKPIIDALASEPAQDRTVIFEVDFDTQKDVVRALGAQRQSTLIAYRGMTETARSVGETRKEALGALFESVLAE
ncbi:thioredoxin family protein [Paroceanicella profunda]|uniref:Thioredoxin family protein n=1 Tax=Paroceanicella profunda TaxID=2579971 RepID=A0A5B8G1K6_9RHOB|nr:thioredoxin family protein [Paroceanicella profunda]QDL93099.1 thioredoxin family protein [Paroceanicella profunda]